MTTGGSAQRHRPLSQIHSEQCWPMTDKISPCEKACPLAADVPSYVIAIAQGKFDDALSVIRETNPFPSICGRVCHQPCEEECNRKLIDEPIAIRWLKRAAVDYAKQKQAKTKKVERTRQEKVAIIGSGPAGLTAAYDLVREGYGVTVYDRSPVAGGWLTNGIPDFILPRKLVEEEIQYIRDLGVEIKTGVDIGRELTLDDLKERGYKVILLATGAQKSAALQIPGADSRHVLSALEVLRKAKLGKDLSFRGRVLVIGGGAVAMDVARTALRLGAKEVHTACLECMDDMPAWSWEVEAAEKEGVTVHTELSPVKFTPSPGGRRLVVDFKRVASMSTDAEGRIACTLADGPGSDYSMDADTVIVAIGQVTDTSFAAESKLIVNRRGDVAVDKDTLETNVPGVFATGDAVTVRGTVTESIAMGHRAAASIDRYLQGAGGKKAVEREEKEVLLIDPALTSPWLVKRARWSMPRLAPADAVRTFHEVYLGFTEEEAIEEAKRCLNCRMCGNCLYGRSQICYETALRLLK
jgi:NADPH-dependent glutamate synthase beta subunit-like oxidoreductase